jgi:hypothetical protein
VVDACADGCYLLQYLLALAAASLAEPAVNVALTTASLAAAALPLAIAAGAAAAEPEPSSAVALAATAVAEPAAAVAEPSAALTLALQAQRHARAQRVLVPEEGAAHQAAREARLPALAPEGGDPQDQGHPN